MDESTIICRCEEVTVQEIKRAISLGASTHDDVKRLTRCGMGPCQWKSCRVPVSKIIHQYTGKPYEDMEIPRLRMPLRPTPLEVLANTNDSKEPLKSVLEEMSEEKEHG